MKLPHGATKVRFDFGEHVFIESPSHPDQQQDVYTVWDSRGRLQGAKLVMNGCNFHDACVIARRQVTNPR